ncbi:MAG: hypothetical protein HQL01_07710 [Nitrospirae bacterium]|nr:hypothetical protein [Nitrospirota bacterium]
MKTKLYIMAALMAIMLITVQHAYANEEPMLRPPEANPIVAGSDGTAYVVSHKIGGGQMSSYTQTSTLSAITSAGDKKSIALEGRANHLGIGKNTTDGDTLVVVAEKPNVTSSASNNGGTGSNSGSVVYIVSLPFNQNATPVQVSLEGAHATGLAVSNGIAYVTAKAIVNNGGDSYMNGGGNGNGSNGNGGTSYIYIVSLKGTINSRVEY